MILLQGFNNDEYSIAASTFVLEVTVCKVLDLLLCITM